MVDGRRLTADGEIRTKVNWFVITKHIYRLLLILKVTYD